MYQMVDHMLEYNFKYWNACTSTSACVSTTWRTPLTHCYTGICERPVIKSHLLGEYVRDWVSPLHVCYSPLVMDSLAIIYGMYFVSKFKDLKFNVKNPPEITESVTNPRSVYQFIKLFFGFTIEFYIMLYWISGIRLNSFSRFVIKLLCNYHWIVATILNQTA